MNWKVVFNSKVHKQARNGRHANYTTRVKKKKLHYKPNYLSKNQSLLKMLENLWTSTRLVIQLWYLLQRFLSVAILSTLESIYAKELVLRIAWFGANVI